MSSAAEGNVGGLFRSAVAHHRNGRLAQAEAAYRKVLAAHRQHSAALHNLGLLTARSGRPAEAIDLFEQVLRIDPDHAEAHFRLGSVFQSEGRLDDAVAAFREAVRIEPGHFVAQNDLGNGLKEQGRLDEAVACFRHALRLRPDYTLAHDNILLSEQYRPGVTLQRMKEIHAEWDERHGVALRSQWRDHANPADPAKPLRIGFVSPDLGHHPVGFFLIKLLENRPNMDIAFACYADRDPDALTERLKTASDEWTDTRELSHHALADRIRSDRVDILFDLAGHTAGNRLLVFARKPAPVQITWMGYVGTTGLGAMDYLIADNRHVPAGTDRFFTEKVIRLPDGYICYDPPAYAPTVGPLPLRRNGFVSFGCFANPAKINRRVVAAWAQILQRVANARLVLKYKNIDSDSNRRRINDLFAAHGVETSRLILEGKSLHNKLLARYGGIDIALDPFPYSGGLTTCEALWMGVPVMTVPGETFASRHSLSHLSNVGLAGLAARDIPHFVELSVELANDPARLAALRAGLRTRMAQSALCDGPKFSRHFAAAMRGVWRDWCSGR